LRFLVDAMLGKLARWLRIIGYDAAYEPGLEDSDLIEKSRREGRVLLTRDAPLFRRAAALGVPSFLIRSLDIPGELTEISGLLGGEGPAGSRCPACNTPLAEAEKGSLPCGSVPDVQPVWVCRTCGKIYWRGSHWRRISETLKVLNE